ncbi:MAG TPA: FHA domain-containing protein [Bacteriovoracaceae bacterium]|nr:FHA domain-containing protein [Bacteriovoracaceae bacterium]
MTNPHQFKVFIHEKGNVRSTYVDKNSFTIGRSDGADLILNDKSVSRVHIKISFEDERIWLEDLASGNGSWLDGEQLVSHKRVAYKNGQVIALAGTNGITVNVEFVGAQSRITSINKILEMSQRAANAEYEIPLGKVANGPEYDSFIIPRPNKKLSNPTSSKAKITLIDSSEALIENLGNLDHRMKDKLGQVKSYAEKNLFDQIKLLVGTEADEIKHAAVEEAKSLIQKAAQEAGQSIEETENLITRRLAELQHSETEAEAKMLKLKIAYQAIEKKVHDLRQTENQCKQQITQITENIKAEEVRIQIEGERLEKIRGEVSEGKKKFEADFEEFQFEERRVKAKIETELLEAKLKVNQILAESHSAQVLKDTLEPAVNNLKVEKSRLETELSELHLKRRTEEYELERITKEFHNVSDQLHGAKISLSKLIEDMDNERHQLLNYKKELEARNDEIGRFQAKTAKDAEETIAFAKADSGKIMAEAHADSNRVISEAHSEARHIVAKANEDLIALNKKLAHVEVEIEQEREKQRHLLEEEMRGLKVEQLQELADLKEKRSNLLKEIAKREIKAREAHDLIVAKAQGEISEYKKIADEECQKIKDQAFQYSEETRLKSDSMLENLKLEIQKKKKETTVQLAALEDQKFVIRQEIDDLERVKEQRLVEVDSEIQAYKNKKQKLIEEALSAKNSEVLSIISTSETKARQIIARAEADAQEIKTQQQAILTELKHSEMHHIKEMKEKAEVEILNKKSERAKAVATNVYALLASEMYKNRNKTMDETFVEKFSTDVKKMIYDTMLDRIGADNGKLQKILKTKENAKNKELRFWNKVKLVGGVGASLLFVLYVFPQIISGPKRAIIAAFSDQGQNKSDVFLDKIKQQRIDAIYNPPTSVDFKESYVDNVLFTTDFMSRKQSKAYHDKWILELNDYFIQNLDVKDTTIIKFVSLETTLLKELMKLKEQVDAKNPEPKIKEMRLREIEFQQKLAGIFADQNKVSRYYDYSEKFWNDFYKTKNP